MGGPTEREKGLSEGDGTRVSRREPPAAEEGARAPRAPRGPSRPSCSSSVDFGLSGSLGGLHSLPCTGACPHATVISSACWLPGNEEHLASEMKSVHPEGSKLKNPLTGSGRPDKPPCLRTRPPTSWGLRQPGTLPASSAVPLATLQQRRPDPGAGAAFSPGVFHYQLFFPDWAVSLQWATGAFPEQEASAWWDQGSTSIFPAPPDEPLSWLGYSCT
ncbi:Centrosomal Protein Of 63 Kda [Manis pentadactyla]|nr:Centrosomal Protein Of 63 Kda [Manis pentadactyla]